MADVLPLLQDMFLRIFELVGEIFTKFGAWGYILGGFIIYTIYRLLVVPIFGGFVRAGASDVVKKVRGENHVANKKN